MNLNLIPAKDSKALAYFLATMNTNQQHHIGYCGEDSEEIYDTLTNDFSDLTLEDSFMVAYHNDQIIAAIGIDVDLATGVAEVWGPFVKDHDLEIADLLWDQLKKKGQEKVKRFAFFFNKDNTFVEAFVKRHHGRSQGGDFVLQKLRSSSVNYGCSDLVTPFSLSDRDSFIELHNQSFPGTYFTAETILKRLNSVNQLFVVNDRNSSVIGYVYLEANSDYNEGNIEYVAVAESQRKNGFGKLLISKAVAELFSF
ncbi:hypothetical protein SAMN04488134_101128 [Amphibacillus marinus]|uniref:N-acetyltransferase domain-containing protein n=1 Tax=Amphibacillus marinus TaxID=872970 RepID=A0A1H8GP39_9BACI|nr:GNAT family N-acetyltransferase [Amphibacillus marinus]SEN45753.1 hypothetical protein SAMN04488134_101128 [Amphibacillus marinus]